MEKLKEILAEILNERLRDMTISSVMDKQNTVKKIKIRPVKIKDILYMQVVRYEGTQVFHENVDCKDAGHASDVIAAMIFGHYKQVQALTDSTQITILIGKKGNVTVKKKQMQNAASGKSLEINLDHNRKKRYVLEEGKPVDFLVELGVMMPNGQVVKKRYDKFRQINRYLEFVEDILPELPKGRKLNIIDFGCAKSYLTFALYYYLRKLQGYDVHIIGLDLKKDVIAHCNDLSRRCGYTDLEFLHGDIADFEGTDSVDMIVTLHACDTATYYALYKAVLWNAGVILSVPCCQHELNQKMKSEALEGMCQYGLIKERFAALATDSMRAMLLESVGYRTQILEFIDMEHTPKNILIRAVRKGSLKPCVPDEKYQTLKQLIGAAPTLERLLKTVGEKKITLK